MMVIAVEYPGYSVSSGQPSELALTKDAVCVFDFVVRHVGVPETDVVFMGSSLGTAVGINLAKQRPDFGMMVRSDD